MPPRKKSESDLETLLANVVEARKELREANSAATEYLRKRADAHAKAIKAKEKLDQALAIPSEAGS